MGCPHDPEDKAKKNGSTGAPCQPTLFPLYNDGELIQVIRNGKVPLEERLAAIRNLRYSGSPESTANLVVLAGLTRDTPLAYVSEEDQQLASAAQESLATTAPSSLYHLLDHFKEAVPQESDRGRLASMMAGQFSQDEGLALRLWQYQSSGVETDPFANAMLLRGLSKFNLSPARNRAIANYLLSQMQASQQIQGDYSAQTRLLDSASTALSDNPCLDADLLNQVAALAQQEPDYDLRDRLNRVMVSKLRKMEDTKYARSLLANPATRDYGLARLREVGMGDSTFQAPYASLMVEFLNDAISHEEWPDPERAARAVNAVSVLSQNGMTSDQDHAVAETMCYSGVLDTIRQSTSPATHNSAVWYTASLIKRMKNEEKQAELMFRLYDQQKNRVDEAAHAKLLTTLSGCKQFKDTSFLVREIAKKRDVLTSGDLSSYELSMYRSVLDRVAKDGATALFPSDITAMRDTCKDLALDRDVPETVRQGAVKAWVGVDSDGLGVKKLVTSLYKDPAAREWVGDLIAESPNPQGFLGILQNRYDASNNAKERGALYKTIARIKMQQAQA